MQLYTLSFSSYTMEQLTLDSWLKPEYLKPQDQGPVPLSRHRLTRCALLRICPTNMV